MGRARSPLVVLLIACCVVVKASEDCSIDQVPTFIDTNNSVADSEVTLFLSNFSSGCNESVNIWHFCISVNASGENTIGTAEHGNITFGIWRREYATYKQILLEEVRISPDAAALDVFCQRMRVKNGGVNISDDDVLGVIYSQSSVFNLLVASKNDSSANDCEGKVKVNGESVRCMESQYSFYLGLYQDVNYEEPSVSPKECEVTVVVPGTNATIMSVPVWVYAVLAVLLLLVIVAVFIIVLLFVQLRKMSQRKNFDISTKKPSSPRYVETGGVDILENKMHRGSEGDGSLNIVKQNSGTSSETTHTGTVVEDETTTPVMSGMFSYPPPASRAPLPPLETSISSVDNDGIPEMNVRGLSGEQNQVGQSKNETTTNGVPHYPLKISTSVPTMRSVSVEEDTGADSLYDNEVFETKPSRGSSTPPVPAPRKATIKKKTSNTLPSSGVSNKMANLSTDKRTHKDVAVEGGGGTVIGNKPAHDYVNVKHSVGRLKSAPIKSDSPVYAEPMVTNQRTRIMSLNPGISKTPPLPSRKPIKPRQRSVSGGDSSPLALARFFSNPPRSLDGSVSSNPCLDKIVESDELTHDNVATSLAQPGEYLEPVSKKSQKKS